MKKILIIFFSVILLFVWQTLHAETASVAGKWEMKVQSPRGERIQPMEFIQDGENLKVLMTGRDGNALEGKGIIKDNKIEWSVVHDTPRGTFTMTYQGTVDGDTMTGTAEFGDRGSGTWTAARKKDQ